MLVVNAEQLVQSTPESYGVDSIGNKNLDADENGQERILRFFSAYSALVRVPKMALTNYQ